MHLNSSTQVNESASSSSNPIPPPSETVPSLAQDQLSRRTLGYLFAGVLLVFLGVFVYFVVWIVAPMTQPSAYFDALTKSLQQSTGPASKTDPLTVDTAVMLEYANADIRLAGAQVAFALVGGLFFAAIGVLLMAASISGALKIGARTSGGNLTLSSTAPGVACLVFGATIVGFGVIRDISRPMRGEVRRATGVNFERGQDQVPPAAKGRDANPSVSKSEMDDVNKKRWPNNQP